MILGRQLKPPDHLHLAFTGFRGGLLILGLGRPGRDHTGGREGLKLDGIGLGCHGGVDQASGHGHVAVVVYSGLGDDEAGVAVAHDAARDFKFGCSFESGYHAVHPPSTARFWPVT